MLVWNGTISAATGAGRLSNFKNNDTTPDTVPNIIDTTSSTIVERGIHTTTNFTNSHAFDPSTLAPDFDLLKVKRFFPTPHVDLVDYQPVTTNGSTGLSLQGFGPTGNVTLDNKCLVALNWPVQT
jgi:hypothetical protein